MALGDGPLNLEAACAEVGQIKIHQEPALIAVAIGAHAAVAVTTALGRLASESAKLCQVHGSRGARGVGSLASHGFDVDYPLSLPGTFEEPKAPVFVHGALKLTLKGDTIVVDSLKLLNDYVKRRYAGARKERRAGHRPNPSRQ